MTSTPVKLFTMTSPKRSDVAGSPEQAFGHGKNVLDYLIGGIKSDNIAAILYVSATGLLQALYAPQLHTSLDGTPISILGNASGKLNEFSLVELTMDQLGMLPCFSKTDTFSPLDKISIATTLLLNTRWKNGTLFGTAMPNFTIIYFGDKVPSGKIWTDDTKHELALLGPGYELWGNLMSKAIQYETDASNVMDAAASAKDATYANYYADKRSKSGLVSDRDGPSIYTNTVDSDHFVRQAENIRKLFTPTPTPTISPPTPNNTTVKVMHSSDEGKEEEASKGLAKTMLLVLTGQVNFETTTITNVKYPELTAGMEIVATSARAGRPQAFVDLAHDTFEIAKTLNPFDLRCTEMSMQICPKNLSVHMLAGNYALSPVTSVLREANAVDILAFAPQRDNNHVMIQRSIEQNASLEHHLNLSDAHRVKPTTKINNIGSIKSIRDVISLCINLGTIIRALTPVSETRSPILHQLFERVIKLLVNPEFNTWLTHCKSDMPSLHLKLLSVLDVTFMNIAKGASSFLNVNFYVNKADASKIDLTYYRVAIKAVAALEEQITQAQAQMTPLVVHPSTIARFNQAATATPNNNRNRSNQADTPPNDRAAAPKRDGTTPDSGAQPKKKRTNTATGVKEFDPKQMGVFYANQNVPSANVFPSGKAKSICPDFTCKGRECTAENCVLEHPRNIAEIGRESTEAIALNFKKNNSGWLSNYHFHKAELSPEARSMLGGANGINNSKKD